MRKRKINATNLSLPAYHSVECDVCGKLMKIAKENGAGTCAKCVSNIMSRVISKEEKIKNARKGKRGRPKGSKNKK